MMVWGEDKAVFVTLEEGRSDFSSKLQALIKRRSLI
jgi:hypothetical protein